MNSGKLSYTDDFDNHSALLGADNALVEQPVAERQLTSC
jgi:hypothetical protein